MDGYNGYANYETWNVSLWLNSDEYLYKLVKTCKNYKEAVQKLNYFGFNKTGDGVSYRSKKLNKQELNDVIKEMRSA